MALTPELFDDAVGELGPSLMRRLRFLTGGREQDAEDLLQRSFARAWRKGHRFEGGDLAALRPWLGSIVQSEYLTYLRAQGRRARLSQGYELERMASPPEPFERGSIDGRALAGCLKRLSGRDRRIVELYFGLEPEEGDEGAPPRPRDDATIAAHVGADDTTPWSPARVRKRRQLALLQLRACLDLKEAAAQEKRAEGSRGRGAMGLDDAGRDPTGRLPQEQGARLLSGEAGPWPSERDALSGSVEARVALGRLLDVEHALAARALSRADEGAEGAAPPLSPAQRATLLALREADAVPGEREAGDAPRVGSGARLWPALALMAAALGMLLGGGALVRLASRDAAPTQEELRLRGDGDAPEAAPLLLATRRPGEATAALIDLVEIGPGRWRATVPADRDVQLRIRAPDRGGASDGAEGAPAAQASWSAQATAWVRPAGGEPRPLGPQGWEVGGSAVSGDLALGPTFRLSGLSALGIGPGDTLGFEVQRGPRHFTLEVELSPGEAPNP